MPVNRPCNVSAISPLSPSTRPQAPRAAAEIDGPSILSRIIARAGLEPPVSESWYWDPPLRVAQEIELILAGDQHRAGVRPVDVCFQGLHRVRVGIDLLTLVGFLDAPVDHVAKRRELVHAHLILRERVRMRVGG